jgi:hypothetical protein
MAVKIEIEVEIDENGEVKMKTHGLKGNECIDELKSFEKSLGKMKDTQKTSEYYEKSTTTSKVRSKTK